MQPLHVGVLGWSQWPQHAAGQCSPAQLIAELVQGSSPESNTEIRRFVTETAGSKGGERHQLSANSQGV